MLRIDDTSSIDTSLVTCAEYQLFIDEMRARDRNHQPDHWPEHHFPPGQGCQPVFGMRRSDATAFCEWLTTRGQSDWQYRLPTIEEGTAYPLATGAANCVGYWADISLTSDSDKTFVWASSLRPKTLSTEVFPRSGDDYAVLKLAHAHARVLDQTRTLALDRIRALERDLDLDLAVDLAPDLRVEGSRAPALVLDRARALDRALALACDLAHARDRARALDLDVDINLDRALDAARVYALSRDHDIDPTRIFDPARPREGYLTSSRVRALAMVLARACDVDDYHFDRSLDYARVLNVFWDLLILEQRSRGNLPAFEGIRIVKVRK